MITLKMNYCKGDLGIIQYAHKIPFTRCTCPKPQYWLNPIFAFSTFKNTIPTLDRVSVTA